MKIETQQEQQLRLAAQRQHKVIGNQRLRTAVSQLQQHGKPPADKPGGRAAMRRLRQALRDGTLPVINIADENYDLAGACILAGLNAPNGTHAGDRRSPGDGSGSNPERGAT